MNHLFSIYIEVGVYFSTDTAFGHVHLFGFMVRNCILGLGMSYALANGILTGVT